jgi:hypothetical protein
MFKLLAKVIRRFTHRNSASIFTDIYGKRVEIYNPTYLVGVDSYSGDAPEGLPNASSFPSLLTHDYELAKARYDTLKRLDDKWSFGYRYAYLVVAEEGEGHNPLIGTDFYTLRGVPNQNR